MALGIGRSKCDLYMTLKFKQFVIAATLLGGELIDVWLYVKMLSTLLAGCAATDYDIF